MIVRKRPDGRTILLDDDHQPALVGLHLRASTTAPGRIKALLFAEIEATKVPLPFAEPVLAIDGEPSGFTPEFRLEMN